jgi:hypothetical protein
MALLRGGVAGRSNASENNGIAGGVAGRCGTTFSAINQSFSSSL